MFEINDRVKVTIRGKRRKVYAAGAAECLDGLQGTIEEHKPDSINGESGFGPALLVRFDSAGRTWWTQQTPPSAWWFPPCDLVPLSEATEPHVSPAGFCERCLGTGSRVPGLKCTACSGTGCTRPAGAP